MITLVDYFGPFIHDASATHVANAKLFLERVARLQANLIGHGITFPYNPVTHTLISGTKYGGFRPKVCPVGAEHSSHKEGRGVDIFDPTNGVDLFLYNDERHCLDLGRPQDSLLYRYGLFIEHPDATEGWSHWTDRPYGSYAEGKPRWFRP